MNLACPACKGNELLRVGEIPQTKIFAGDGFSIPLPQSNLFKCKSCNLNFRWPRLSKKELDKIYKTRNPGDTQYELGSRKDWQIAINWIGKELNNGFILDIGCWNGNFLVNLKEDWKRYGVEINPVASSRAVDKGIKIITNDFLDLAFLPFKFDVVTAFDVIEHTEDPLTFIASVCEVTKDNGLIILSSGNTEAPTWKIGRGRYWYCAIPEHMSFINAPWYCFAAEELNLDIAHKETFSHASKSSFTKICLDLSKNIAYLIIPIFFAKLRKIKHLYLRDCKAGEAYNYPPSWMTSKDHLIIMFRKVSSK
jgi:2-polyprenyl-3-methyl-5-hydroxy-6-metoxy-1,4-benzoquinol methylase